MNKITKIAGKIAAWIGRIIGAALLALIIYASWGHLFVTVWDFADPEPFSGKALHNPYAGADFGQARKAILHFHTDRSDGRDAPETIVGAYRDMGYEIVSVADHDRVTPAGIDPGRELGTYEHGLNIFRFHNVVFGADRPLGLQLPLWQGLSARETTLRRLSERYPLVVLNHPGTVRGLIPRQMELLSHYDYIEADRAMDRDFPLWDVALSAGHYSNVIANDDLHDLSRPHAIGRAMTFIMAPGVDSAAVTGALRRGHTYALRVADPAQHPDSLYLPRVESFELSGDTLRVAFSDSARIRFVGQGGEIRREVSGRRACYVFAATDTYIRVEARFRKPGAPDTVYTPDEGYGPGAGGAAIYLNPVARYSPSLGAGPLNASYSTRDLPPTVLRVAAHALLIVVSGAGIWLLLLRRPRSRRRRSRG